MCGVTHNVVACTCCGVRSPNLPSLPLPIYAMLCFWLHNNTCGWWITHVTRLQQWEQHERLPTLGGPSNGVWEDCGRVKAGSWNGRQVTVHVIFMLSNQDMQVIEIRAVY